MVQEGTSRRQATGAAAHTPAVVEVVDSTGRLGDRGQWLTAHARRAAAELGVLGEVRVRVVDDLAMTHAHQRWRGEEGTTDVLTFDYAAPAASGALPVASRQSPVATLDADLLVCLDEASRQAAARGHAPERELILYVVHGLLHCLGYDDHDEAASAVMHQREDEVLTRIGVGATYAAPASPKGQPL